jgi:hypothetical protein
VWEGKAGNYNPKICRETSVTGANAGTGRWRRRKRARFVAFSWPLQHARLRRIALRLRNFRNIRESPCARRNTVQKYSLPLFYS